MSTDYPYPEETKGHLIKRIIELHDLFDQGTTNKRNVIIKGKSVEVLNRRCKQTRKSYREGDDR